MRLTTAVVFMPQSWLSRAAWLAVACILAQPALGAQHPVTSGTMVSASPSLDGRPAMPCQVLDPELQLSYQGGCENGKAHGQGIARGAHGAFYQGAFENGAKSGYGVKLYPNGDAYAGQWRNDFRNGHGVYEYGEQSPWRGDKYIGDWLNDQRHGRGAYVLYPSGEPFYSDWDQGVPLSLASPTLIRRKRVYEALAPVLGQVGLRVCSVTTDGASPQRVAHGQVVAVQGERIQVRVDTPDVLRNSHLTLNPRWDLMTDWTQCADDHNK